MRDRALRAGAVFDAKVDKVQMRYPKNTDYSLPEGFRAHREDVVGTLRAETSPSLPVPATGREDLKRRVPGLPKRGNGGGDSIKAIKARLGIEEVLAHFGVEVPDSGRDVVMIHCPFHDDRNPSMAVYRRQGRAWCFACNTGGDVLDITALFLQGDVGGAIRYWLGEMGMEGLGRQAAGAHRGSLRRLAEKASILSEWGLRPRDPSELKVFDRLYESKDRIDEELEDVSDRDTVISYLKSLKAWRGWSEAVLSDECGREALCSSPRFFKEGDKRLRLYRINRWAAKVYHHFLLECPDGETGRDYLRSRGIDEETIRTFMLGYAPRRLNCPVGMEHFDCYRDFLYRRAMRNKFEREDFLRAGLGRVMGDGVHDFFHGRVIFPIFDPVNRVVALAGRTLEGGKIKYLNSPATPVFQKGRHLYGLNLTRPEIVRQGYAILVEGYIDLILLWQHGIRNVAATMGTALGRENLRLLSRLTRRVILAFDGDQAGLAAARSAQSLQNDFDIELWFMPLDGGMDPADIVSAYGAEGFLSRLKGCVPVKVL